MYGSPHGRVEGNRVSVALSVSVPVPALPRRPAAAVDAEGDELVRPRAHAPPRGPRAARIGGGRRDRRPPARAARTEPVPTLGPAPPDLRAHGLRVHHRDRRPHLLPDWFRLPVQGPKRVRPLPRKERAPRSLSADPCLSPAARCHGDGLRVVLIRVPV